MLAPSVIHSISSTIHATIVTIQQHHPEWLTQKYRGSAWQSAPMQTAFIEKLSMQLNQVSGLEIRQRVDRYLRMLFQPDFFDSASYRQLTAAIDAFLAAGSPPQNHATPTRLNGSGARSAIAILLLDAENMKLSAAEETVLQTACRYPIQIRIAFANWRNILKQDSELHERGYQLIHVPPGKNAADMQMTAIGASLFLQYPGTQEVLVCSSDGHLVPLCNLLQTQGLIVHSVRRQSHLIVATHWATGQFKTFSCDKLHINSKADLEQKLVSLLHELTTRSPGAYIPISTLSSQFKQRYGKSVTESLQDWSLGNQYLKFLKSCDRFKLQQVDQGWQIALARA